MAKRFSRKDPQVGDPVIDTLTNEQGFVVNRYLLVGNVEQNFEKQKWYVVLTDVEQKVVHRDNLRVV